MNSPHRLPRLGFLVLLVILVWAGTACAQPGDTTKSGVDSVNILLFEPEPYPDESDSSESLFEDHPLERPESRIMYEGLPVRIDLGVQGKLVAPYAGRLQMMFGGRVLQFSPFSFAITGGRDELGTFFSLNPLISLTAYLGGLVRFPLGLLLLIPQAVPNLSFELPIVSRLVGLTAGERTDYFWKNGVFRVHTETQLGLRLHAPGWPQLMVEAAYVIPHTRSVMERSPYFGVGVHAVWDAGPRH